MIILVLLYRATAACFSLSTETNCLKLPIVFALGKIYLCFMSDFEAKIIFLFGGASFDAPVKLTPDGIKHSLSHLTLLMDRQ